MAEFVDYYAELELDPSLDCSQIEKELKNLRKKWRTRQNASDLGERQKAELKSKYIDEALLILTDETKRSEYDNKLIRYKHTQPTDQSSSKSESKQEQPKDIDYSDIETLLHIIDQLVENGTTAEVRQFSLNAISHGVENAQIYFWYARACMSDEAYSEAEEGFKRSLALNPNEEKTTYWYAELLYQMKKYDSAKTLYLQLHNNGNENDVDVNAGLIRCLFALDQEPMASKFISDYIMRNHTDMNFKRIAQKEYLNAILKVKSEYLYSTPTQAQLETMMSYAQKANSILPNNRAREAIEECENIRRGGSTGHGGTTGGGTSTVGKNINIISILSIVFSFVYPIIGLVLGIITVKQAKAPEDKKYKKRGVIAIVISIALCFFVFVLPLIAAAL